MFFFIFMIFVHKTQVVRTDYAMVDGGAEELRGVERCEAELAQGQLAGLADLGGSAFGALLGARGAAASGGAGHGSMAPQGPARLRRRCSFAPLVRAPLLPLP